MFPSRRFFEDDEPLPEAGGDEAYADEDALEALREADVATLERMQGMAEDFATWLHQKGAEQMQAQGDKAVAELRQLSHSFNRAARAVRQIMVLKEEAAGLRPTPHARAAASQAVNRDWPGDRDAVGRDGGGRERRNGDDGFGRDRSDLDDYDDENRREAEAEIDAYLATLLEAVEVDIAAAEPATAERLRRQSNVAKLTKILDDIPHPNLDAALVRLQLEWLHDLFWLKPGEEPPRRG